MMSDIQAMFHQVKVMESDTDFLRFLWWPQGNVDNTPEEFRMTVHLFDAVSSPSIANFHSSKWISNSRAVLAAIPPKDRAKEVKELDLSKDQLPME